MGGKFGGSGKCKFSGKEQENKERFVMGILMSSELRLSTRRLGLGV